VLCYNIGENPIPDSCECAGGDPVLCGINIEVCRFSSFCSGVLAFIKGVDMNFADGFIYGMSFIFNPVMMGGFFAFIILIVVLFFIGCSISKLVWFIKAYRISKDYDRLHRSEIITGKAVEDLNRGDLLVAVKNESGEFEKFFKSKK
jgi:uncharacterized membrane protein